MAGEFWINLFGSCVMEQEPQPNRHRPKISRDMIGQPTNFRHTSHVGSSDIGEMSTLQSTMKGKGDEEMQHIQVFFIQIYCPDLPFTSAFLYLIAPVCRFPTS